MSNEPHLSVTQLKMYLRCPLQYFFRYVCGVRTPPTAAMTLGRTIHQAIAHNYRQKIESCVDLPLADVTDMFSTYWDREVEQTASNESEDPVQMKEEGLRLLTAYHEEVAPTVQPVEVEREFLVDTGATTLPLKGYIDLIDDERVIVDHKTTKRSFPRNAAERDLQLTAYALAYRALRGYDEGGVRLDVIVRNKKPKIQQLHSARTREDIERFVRLAQQVERGIQTEAFYPNEGYLCGTCGYGQMCEKW